MRHGVGHYRLVRLISEFGRDLFDGWLAARAKDRATEDGERLGMG